MSVDLMLLTVARMMGQGPVQLSWVSFVKAETDGVTTGLMTIGVDEAKQPLVLFVTFTV